MLNSSSVVQGMTIKLRPCLRIGALERVDEAVSGGKLPAGKGVDKDMDTWLALSSLYYILYGAYTRLLFIIIIITINQFQASTKEYPSHMRTSECS